MYRSNLDAHGFPNRAELGFNSIDFYIDYCNSFKDKELSACWMSNSWYFYRLQKFDLENMYKNCKQALSDDAFARCYSRGLALSIALDQAQSLKRVKISDYCSKIENSNQYKWCNHYIVEFLLRTGEFYKDYTYQYCNQTQLDYRKECFSFVKSTLEKLKQKQDLTIFFHLVL